MRKYIHDTYANRHRAQIQCSGRVHTLNVLLRTQRSVQLLATANSTLIRKEHTIKLRMLNNPLTGSERTPEHYSVVCPTDGLTDRTNRNIYSLDCERRTIKLPENGKIIHLRARAFNPAAAEARAVPSPKPPAHTYCCSTCELGFMFDRKTPLTHICFFRSVSQVGYV